MKSRSQSKHRNSIAEGRLRTSYTEEIGVVVRALENALAKRDLRQFYQMFRTTSLPYLCATYRDDSAHLFPACVEIVHELGAVSPAVALAVENHFYVTSAIATFPTETDPDLHRRRNDLLETIVKERWLVANTNSKVHNENLGQIGTKARRDGTGFVINGVASYTSLATDSDLLILMTELEGEGLAVFSIAPVKGNPFIEIGPYLFPSAMQDSDTRRITFHNLVLTPEALVASSKSNLGRLLVPFEMAWHQLLIPALYLGAAARAIDEVRAFLVSTKTREGQPLAQLDGMIIDVGRLVLEYQTARCTVEKAGEALSYVRELPRDALLIERAVQFASAAKYAGTRTAESIVTTARRIVGARAFFGNCQLERLSQEVMFASLGPEVSAVIERRFGKQAMEGIYSGQAWGTYRRFSEAK